jgi:Reverse transcriptase (RNA-dependent DNA polymerase)
VERYKTRLVARRYTQTHGVDYYETYAPVAKMNTIQILFSTAVNQGWTLYQMDVKNVFLQRTLEEEVYMTLPPGHAKENYSNLACRLKKLINGLKQSPRVWHGKLNSYLNSCNFAISSTDHSLFIKRNDISIIIIVLVYIDDLIITGNDQREIREIKSRLKENFDIKDLGLLKYFLGIKIAH